MRPIRIESIDQLNKESANRDDFFILSNHNLRSSKRIEWDEEEKRFFILKLIDDSEQVLTEEQVVDTGYTNSGYAMTKGAFFRDV